MESTKSLLSLLSVLIGCKNNLEYTKEFYSRFRLIYPTVELCFVSYGSTDGTDDYLINLTKDDPNVKIGVFTEESTFSDTFNKCVELATKDFIVFMHNDIVVLPNLLEPLIAHAVENPRSAVSYTTIEPPIFTADHRAGKIVRDFGSDFSNVNMGALEEFHKRMSTSTLFKDKREEGFTFFHLIDRSYFLSIGGFDNLFNPFFCEDSDLFNRYVADGITGTVCSDALCYHFVSKTSRFSEEYKNRTEQIEANSVKNLFRKWGRNPRRYDIGIMIHPSTTIDNRLFTFLEPCANHIQSNVDPEWVASYIASEQPKTKFDLSKKFIDFNTELENDIILELYYEDLQRHGDGFKNLIMDVGHFVEEGTPEGTYHTFDGCKSVIHVRQSVPKNKDLVNVNSQYYQSLLLQKE